VGGLATAIVDTRSVVFAATAVGIQRSADSGKTWQPAGVRNSVPFAEVVAPSARFAQDHTLFACAADGLYRSSDNGAAWQPVLVGGRMLSVATSSVEGLDTLVLAASETDGVLRSEDGGVHWTGANAGLLDLTVLALALSPQFATDRLGFAGTASGLYRTRNGARSWRAIDTGVAEPAVQCLAISPRFAHDRLVLAGTEADGLLRSDDAGSTWHRPPGLVDQGVTAVTFSTRRPTIAAAVEAGIAVSADGGLTWRLTGAPPGVVLSLTFVDNTDGEVLLAGLHRRGIARSNDDGATWDLAIAGLSARLLTSLVMSPAFAADHTLFTAGPQEGVRVSRDAGRTWVAANAGLDDPAVLGLTVSPAYAKDQTVYAATAGGVHVSRDGAATWAPCRGASAPARAIVAGPGSSVVAALAGGILLASDDGARTWRTLASAFDGGEIILLALSPGYAQDRTLFVATTSPSAEVVLWRSVDRGARWDQWLVEPAAQAGFAGGQRFMAFGVSPDYANDALVFAGLGARVLKPLRHAREVRAGRRRPVWRGADLGDGAVAVTAVAPSPSFADDSTLFVATNAGVFVARDGGDTYAPWSEALVPPAVVALAVSPSFRNDRLVFALGLGGSIWRRHDYPV